MLRGAFLGVSSGKLYTDDYVIHGRRIIAAAGNKMCGDMSRPCFVYNVINSIIIYNIHISVLHPKILVGPKLSRIFRANKLVKFDISINKIK